MRPVHRDRRRSDMTCESSSCKQTRRQLTRRGFRVLLAVALLPFLGIGVLWARSLGHSDRFSWRPGTAECYEIASRNGWISLVHRTGPAAAPAFDADPNALPDVDL